MLRSCLLSINAFFDGLFPRLSGAGRVRYQRALDVILYVAFFILLLVEAIFRCVLSIS